jgi:hypothetical protein
MPAQTGTAAMKQKAETSAHSVEVAQWGRLKLKRKQAPGATDSTTAATNKAHAADTESSDRPA